MRGTHHEFSSLGVVRVDRPLGISLERLGMGLVVSGLTLLFDGGVSDGMRPAKLFLGDGIVMGVVLSDWQPY